MGITHTDYKHYKYSITIYTEDLTVIHCMRGLAHFSQGDGYKQIAWSGTTETDWMKGDYCVTYRFTKQEYRTFFQSEAERLLPKGSWRLVGTSNNDPATPSKHRKSNSHM